MVPPDNNKLHIFLSAFMTTMLFYIQGNQWRQSHRVNGWLIILQMSQLDKQHTEGQQQG